MLASLGEMRHLKAAHATTVAVHPATLPECVVRGTERSYILGDFAGNMVTGLGCCCNCGVRGFKWCAEATSVAGLWV